MERWVLSFGGGVNSVALMIWLLRTGKPLDAVVFADTGGEVPETYEYLPVAQEYLSANGVPFEVVGRAQSGRPDLYQTCWERRVFPSAIWRWSTRDFKVTPILRFYRSLGGHINQYIAIAFDELERMKDSRVNYVTNHYPLVDERITRSKCEEIIEKEGLPLPVKSGCYFCPFNSVDRWRWLHRMHPELFANALALEENSKHFPAQRLTDQAFRNRGDITLRSLASSFDSGNQALDHAASVDMLCGGDCMT